MCGSVFYQAFHCFNTQTGSIQHALEANVCILLAANKNTTIYFNQFQVAF